MSDDFVYRNENTGDIARYPYRSARLEMLPNWVTLQDPEADTEPEPPHEPPTPKTPQPPPATPPDGPPTGPVTGGDGSGPHAAPERPARSAPKADWQAYARELAQDSDEEAAVDGLTKDQLIEQYGGDS